MTRESRLDFIQLLSEPSLRRLWLSGVAINIVRWLEILAFSIYVLEDTGSPFLVALTLFARMAPLLLSANLASVTGTIDRRALLWGIMLTLAITDGALFLISLLGHLDFRLVLVAAVIAGLAWTIENPLRRTMLAEGAGIERLHVSMGLETLSNQSTRALGPAIGGLLVETIGISGVLAVGLLLHGSAFLAICRLDSDHAGTRKIEGKGGPAGLREGLAFVLSSRLLRATMLVTLIFNLWAFPYVSLAPVIGERILGLSPTGIGLLMATEGLGGVCGAIMIMIAARARWFVPIYTFGAILFAFGTGCLGLIDQAWLAFLMLFLAGLGIAGFNGMQSTIPLAATPADLRVRVLGILTVCIGSAPLGFLLAGLLAEWFGAATAQVMIGAQALAALIAVVIFYPEMVRTGLVEPQHHRPETRARGVI
ncbi:MAG: MFS transporter [Geminicoccaceae bacterium]